MFWVVTDWMSHRDYSRCLLAWCKKLKKKGDFMIRGVRNTNVRSMVWRNVQRENRSSVNWKLTRPLKKCNTAFSLVRRREEDCWGEVARWPRNDPCGHGHSSQIKQLDKCVCVCVPVCMWVQQDPVKILYDTSFQTLQLHVWSISSSNLNRQQLLPDVIKPSECKEETI